MDQSGFYNHFPGKNYDYPKRLTFFSSLLCLYILIDIYYSLSKLYLKYLLC